MPTVLNFDTLTYDTVEIEKRGQKWKLRDDVPTKVLMRSFALFTVQEQLQKTIQQAQSEFGNDSAAALALVEAQFDVLERQAATNVGAIFRHTYPDTSDEDILQAFSFDELIGIAQIFFTHRSNKSRQQQSAISEQSTASLSTAPTPPANSPVALVPKNRATRRATAGAKRN